MDIIICNYFDGLKPASLALFRHEPIIASLSSSVNKAGTIPAVKILLINSRKPSSTIYKKFSNNI